MRYTQHVPLRADDKVSKIATLAYGMRSAQVRYTISERRLDHVSTPDHDNPGGEIVTPLIRGAITDFPGDARLHTSAMLETEEGNFRVRLEATADGLLRFFGDRA